MFLTCRTQPGRKESRFCCRSSSSQHSGWNIFLTLTNIFISTLLRSRSSAIQMARARQRLSQVAASRQQLLASVRRPASCLPWGRFWLADTRRRQPRSANQKRRPKARMNRQHTVFLPADDLVGEEDPLHLGVLDMVASLILHHLLAGRVD